MRRTRKPSRQARAVLASLIRAPGVWRYGYDISQETGLKSGTLYPLLIRLADQGVLESGWRDSDQPGRPPRHVYRLTPDGLALARSLDIPAPAPAQLKAAGA